MSKNAIVQAKNKVSNKISDSKKSIDSTKKEIQESIGLIKTFCEFPSRGINFSIKWIDAIDAVRMLLEILAGLIGRKLSELKIDLSKFLVTKVFSLAKQFTFDLSEILKACFACKINPIIPDWLYEEGINIEIEQIDNKGMFKVNPDSRAGSLLYGGSGDMNRFLFDVIQSSSPLDWPEEDSIATFEFKERGTNVGYDIDKEEGSANNKGAQNTDKRNNVINMKIKKSKYDTKTFIDFMNDYLNSQDTIFEPKLVFAQSIDVDYGVISRLSNLDTLTLRKQVEFETVVEELYTCGFDNPNVTIDNSFFDFSTEQKESIEQKVEQKKRGVLEMNECCCGADSTIDTSSIVNFNERLKNVNEISLQTTVINNGLNQMATLSTNNVNETDKSKGFWEFITRFIGNLSTTMTMMVLSPKLNFLIITLFYMLNGKCRFNGVRDYIKNIQCVIREIMQKILMSIIYEFLLPKILKSMSFILKCFLKIVIKSKLKGYKLSIESLTPFGDSEIMKEVKSIMGSPQELINGTIDAGVDSAENAGQQSIENRISE